MASKTDGRRDIVTSTIDFIKDPFKKVKSIGAPIIDLFSYKPNYNTLKTLDNLKVEDIPESKRTKYTNILDEKGITNPSTRQSYLERFYRNDLFIDKFGIDTFNEIKDPKTRDEYFEGTIVQEKWFDKYNPHPIDRKTGKPILTIIEHDKGMGYDFEYYDNILSIKDKRELIDKGYRTSEELKKWQEERRRDVYEKKNFTTTGRVLMTVNPAGLLGETLATSEAL